MIPSTRSTRGLAAGVAALGLLAVVAAFTYAEVGSSWSVNGSKVTSTLLPTIQVHELGSGVTLLSKVLGQQLAVSCSAAEVMNAKLETEGTISSGSKLKFSGCTTKIGGTTSKACEPHIGAEKGVIVSSGMKGSLVLQEKVAVTRFEPTAGTTLATLEMSEECSLGEKLPVIGAITLRDAELANEAVKHVFVEGPSTELWVISKTAEHAATIDGSVTLALTGAHLGLKWSGTPG